MMTVIARTTWTPVKNVPAGRPDRPNSHGFTQPVCEVGRSGLLAGKFLTGVQAVRAVTAFIFKKVFIISRAPACAAAGLFVSNQRIDCLRRRLPGTYSDRFSMAASSIFLLSRNLENGSSADFQHLKRLEIYLPSKWLCGV